MVSFIREFLFRRKGKAPAREPHDQAELRLAAAPLLVEAAKPDAELDSTERARIATLLAGRFGMDGADVAELIEAADEETELAGRLYGFTKEVRLNFDHAERISMIEMLWEVAYADGSLHDFESNMLRRVAGLLYVTDRDSGEARKRVLGRLSEETGGAGDSED